MAIRVPVRGVRTKSESGALSVSTASSDATKPGKAHGIRLRYRYMLSIDPGLSGTGVVYWLNGYPKNSIVLHPEGKTLVERCQSLAEFVWEFWFENVRTDPHRSKFQMRNNSILVIEQPEYHEGARGQVSTRKGDIIKLSILVGILSGGSDADWDVALVPVRDWKGQLPKSVVKLRMQKHYGRQCQSIGVKSHAWDALGIGHWALQQEWMR